MKSNPTNLATLCKATLAVSILILSASPALALDCPNQYVKAVSISGSGDIIVSLSGLGESLGLCNVERDAYGLGRETCKTLFASLSSAMLAGKKVTVWLSDTAGTCASKPAWSNLTTTYGFFHLRVEN